MAVLFERDFARVWTDGSTPYVFSSVARAPDPEELDELAAKQVKMIYAMKREFGDVYSIFDLSLCPDVPEHIIRFYITMIIPVQFNAGLKHKAFVLPEKNAVQEIMTRAAISLPNFSTSIHSSFESALNETNQKRIQAMPLKEKSFLSFFNTSFRQSITTIKRLHL